MRRFYIIGLLLLSFQGFTAPVKTFFVSNVCIMPFHNYKYHTCEDIDFYVNDRLITIPYFFETDLASIPRILWIFASPAHSSFMRPAIAHDWFYKESCEFNRAEADLIFYHMLRREGVGFFHAKMMYWGVRTFGWMFFNAGRCHDGFKGLDKKV